MNPKSRAASEAERNPSREPNPTVLRILEDYLAELERGVPPHPDELLARHPEVAETLQEYLASLEFLHRAAQKLRSTDEPLEQVTPEQKGGLGQLGDYRLIREIGRGGMGVVYEAEQISLRRSVALKVLPFAAALESKRLQRFKNEAQAAAALHHGSIVPVYGVGCERGVHYYAMQFIDGRTLATVIRELRQLRGLAAAEETALPRNNDPAAATIQPVGLPFETESSTRSPTFFRTMARLGAQAAAALEYAHELSVIHRDIKPANLLVDVQGQLWITDFGLAQVRSDTRLTMTGDVVGTLRYMSPEQALAKRVVLDHRTDIYSLGVTLYELLTLEPVFTGQDREELLRQIAFEEPKPPRRIDPSIPTELETIVLKAIAKNPEERYATAKDLEDDLGRFLRDETIRARLPSLPQRVRKWARRHRPMVATATVALATLFVLVVVGSLVSNTLIRRERDQARNEGTRAEQAVGLAKHRLFEAKLAEARASRWGRQVGQRFASLQALTEAAQLARELGLDEERRMNLRNDIIASLALSDVRIAKEWEGWPTGSQGLAFDSDLERYAYSDPRGNISVRRVADDRELARLSGEGPTGPNTGAPFLRFSPDGALLAARYHRKAGQTTNLRLWDWSRGEILFEPAFTLDWFGLDFSPDGRHFTLFQPDGVLTIREVTGGNEVRRMIVGSPPTLAAWSPDGAKLAVVCSRGSEVQLRDAATGRLLRAWPTPSFVWALAWHPDGSLLATGCEDTYVHVWEAATGRPHAVLRGHTGSAAYVSFAPGGDTLISSGWDGTSRLWDLWSGIELVRFAGDANRFSRDGRRLVSRAGSRVIIWEVAHSREYRALSWSPVTGRESVRGGGLSREGRWLTVAAGDGFRLWDLDSGRSLARLPTTYAVMAAFHPSGRELFTSGRAGLYRWPWNVAGGLLRIGPPRKLPIEGLLERISLDAEGQILAVARLGTSTGGASVIDLQSPVAASRHLTHAMAVSAAVSPDGRWIATGVHGGSGVRVWETRSGQLIRELVPNYLDTLVAFSPDGRWLATGHAGVLVIWEAGSWRQVRQLKEQGGDNIPYAAFTPDSKLLAVTISPSRIELVDTATWRPLARLQGPDTDSVMLLGFTPDGAQLVVAREAGGVRIWNLRRVREQLKDLGLEWNAPPFPPQTRPAGGGPLRVQVDLGPLEDAKPK